MTAAINARIAEELGVGEHQVTCRGRACSTAAPRCRSSPGTARRSPGRSTTRSCARSRSACATCGSWRSAAPRSSSRSASQGKLDDALEAQILAADSKARLEDIYLPFKPKRRTKAQIAREAGLEPLADGLLADPTLDPPARRGRRSSTPSRASPTPRRRSTAPARSWSSGSPRTPTSSVSCASGCGRGAGSSRRSARARRPTGAKFADYFDFAEPFTKLPSHRILAMFRGEKEEVLDLTMEPEAVTERAATGRARTSASIAARSASPTRAAPADRWLLDTVRWAWRTRILVHLGIDLRMRLWQAAEDEAVRVFAANLRDLLLAAPAGTRATMGLDPGFRTGVKVAVVDATGKVVATDTIYPHVPQQQLGRRRSPPWRALAAAHGVELVAIGNGTASRETDKLAADLIKAHPGAAS